MTKDELKMCRETIHEMTEPGSWWECGPAMTHILLCHIDEQQERIDRMVEVLREVSYLPIARTYGFDESCIDKETMEDVRDLLKEAQDAE